MRCRLRALEVVGMLLNLLANNDTGGGADGRRGRKANAPFLVSACTHWRERQNEWNQEGTYVKNVRDRRRLLNHLSLR